MPDALINLSLGLVTFFENVAAVVGNGLAKKLVRLKMA